MKIERKKVARIHYTLTNKAGEELGTTRDREPMAYLHGSSNILYGLERELEGKQAGDKVTVTLRPEDAYGPRREEAVQRVPLKRFGSRAKLHPGERIVMNTGRRRIEATVLKVGRFNVDLDVNHPLAGQTLTFDVEVIDVRDAEPEELRHGHPHGPGGHSHD